MLSAKSRRRALLYTFGGDLSAGLMHGATESDDPAYARQPIRFRAADDSTVENINEVAFPPYSVDSDASVVSIALYDDEGDLIDTVPVRERKPFAGDQVVIRPGEIRVRYVVDAT